MFRMSRGRALDERRAPEAESAPAQLLAGVELSDDALEHVIGGLERIYVFDPDDQPAAEPA